VSASGGLRRTHDNGVKYMGNFKADHLDLIGWNLGLKILRSFNAKRFYHHVAENIKKEGL